MGYAFRKRINVSAFFRRFHGSMTAQVHLWMICDRAGQPARVVLVMLDIDG